jgi:polar amino acid transport system substrate-binding protein
MRVGGMVAVFGVTPMMRWLALLVLAFFHGPLRAENYVIGIEQIDFYPHYDFSQRQQRGYFVDLIQLFSEKTGHQFKFMPLPVKRLYQSANSGIDFIYPDNPLWRQYNEPGIAKAFSAPVVFTLGSTLVKPELQHISLEQFRSLAVIHGFVPTKWLALKNQYKYRMVDVPDVASALGLVLKGRLDGANIEFNVAQHYLRSIAAQDQLVIAEQLPFTQLPFLLSTVKHPKLLSQFDRFLIDNAEQVAALKRKYQLQEQRPAPVARQPANTNEAKLLP